MPLISSKMTFFHKRVFPVIWFGFLLFVVVRLFSASGDSPASIMPFLTVPVLMAIFGYWVMKKLLFGLADEVLDAGDALMVRSGEQEERISLSDIKNVSYSRYMNPPQVTLSLRRQTVFGDTIVFCAPLTVVPFRSSPVIDDLINRADSARQKR
jgi:hypothetical protein